MTQVRLSVKDINHNTFTLLLLIFSFAVNSLITFDNKRCLMLFIQHIFPRQLIIITTSKKNIRCIGYLKMKD